MLEQFAIERLFRAHQVAKQRLVGGAQGPLNQGHVDEDHRHELEQMPDHVRVAVGVDIEGEAEFR